MIEVLPNRVAASESDLLSVTRALFDPPQAGPAVGVLAHAPPLIANLLRRPLAMPDGLGPTALRLMRDTMAKGMVLALARRGGWRQAAHIRDGGVITGRLWQRHDPPAFHLSPFAMHLCRWLTEHPLRGPDCPPLAHAPATIADEFLLYLALDLTHRARCAEILASQRAARSSALCWLGFPELLTGQTTAKSPPADISVYAFAPWTSGPGALVVEALQTDLTRRWIAIEHAKRRLGRARPIIALGRIQDAVIEAYFSALTSAERHDLAGFLIEACRALLLERPELDGWQPPVEAGEPFRVRNEARSASVSLLRAMRAVRGWVERARGARFFDDEYQVAQLLLKLWEPLGDAAYQRASTIVRDIESIDALLDDG